MGIRRGETRRIRPEMVKPYARKIGKGAWRVSILLPGTEDWGPLPEFRWPTFRVSARPYDRAIDGE